MKISLPSIEISEEEFRSIAKEYVERAIRGEDITVRQVILQTYITACERLKNNLESELSMLQQEGDSA